MKDSEDPLLTTKNLTVGFLTAGNKRVLFKDLNLKLFPSQLVCLMGPNGIGKSTLIRSLAGLHKPLGGAIEIQDADAVNISKQISIVLTHRIHAPNMTVKEVVTYGRYPYLGWGLSLSSSDINAIERALFTVSISDLSGKLISELSDGQLQMVMIARAIAQDTPIILLDEPTAHLDLNNRVEMMKVMKSLSRSLKKAILISTHELDLALQTADLVWLAGHDQDIQTGIPEDLVLNGSFDRVFRLKGFDLKTGRVDHHADKKTSILLEGTGSEYMWTKNALERSGYSVIGALTGAADVSEIVVIVEEGKPRWSLKKGNRHYMLTSIAELIELLESNDCGVPE
jgi:iron complex transport system ATP-binding protein